MKLRVSLAVLLVAGAASAAKPRSKPPEPRPPPPPARPTSIEVSVVEIAGGRAYLQPGAKAGVHKTAIVTINGKEHHVLDVTDSYAVIDLQEGAVHEKDKGHASIVEEQETTRQLPPPRPLATWEHAWTPEAPPSDEQHPQFVPLGEASRSRRYDAMLAFVAGGNVPFSGQHGASIGFVEIDARVHAEPFSAPAAFDFDGALRFWAADDLSTRMGGSTRSYLWVRELMASYGSANGWYAGLGRMKYAASTLGTLDGLRLQANLGSGFTLAAFGGFLPNPLGGELAVDAERFGVEARYYRPDLKLRPEGAVVVHGSMFQGHPDERRVSAMFGVYPGHSRLGGHIEVSNFDADNPWKANPVEITAAGLDESVRFGAFELGSRIDLIEPERSKWLASYLPTSWFCRTVPSAGTPTNAEPCDGASSMRVQGSINLGVSKGMVAATVGAVTSGDVSHHAAEPRILGGFFSGRIVRIAKVLRFELSVSYSDATYVNMLSGTAGVGLTVAHDALDISAYYRRAELQYAPDRVVVATGAPISIFPQEQNGFGGAITLFAASSVMATVQGEAITGNDVNAVYVLGSLVWRPRF